MKTMSGMCNEIDNIIAEYKKECDLSKSYFYATYKTRLMKYDGNVIPAKDRGNIITRTYAFEALSKEDAKLKAPSMFNTSNHSFNPLVRSKMQVEHELLDITEVLLPDIDVDDSKLKHINENKDGLYFCHHVNVVLMPDDNLVVPDSFLGFEQGSIRRKMPHFDSPDKDVAYLYHPWHGAGDGYVDWFEYKHTNCFWKKMNAFFYMSHKTDEDRFYSTEYTSLRKPEREKIKKLEQLKYLSSYIHGFGKMSDYVWRNMNNQGYYFISKHANGDGLPVFIENEYNGFRIRWKTAAERRIELESQIADAKYKLMLLENELCNIN